MRPQENNEGPLSGVVLVDLSSVIVGPACSLALADRGAQVIKIEPPSGDLLRKLGGGAKHPVMLNMAIGPHKLNSHVKTKLFSLKPKRLFKHEH
jgi:crotonobetainyl-CoA:carnitine CoA-transferase CaiB-like acyl-CoA transferase